MTFANLAILCVVVVTSVSAWILRVRMQRRIRRALGKKTGSEMELTSLNTWMKVAEEEERSAGGKIT